MPKLVVLELGDPNQTHDVLDLWLAAGVSGATIIPSAGLALPLGESGACDDLPLLPSLRNLLESKETPHCIIFGVVPDDFNLDGLLQRTVALLGDLDASSSGYLFVVPVTRARGLKRKA